MKREKSGPVIPAETFAAARKGDRAALTALYEATSQELYRSILAMVRDEDLAMDIQQDSYVAAFSHLDQLRQDESFFPWLRSIAVNQARLSLRRRKPLLFSELEEEDEDFTERRPAPDPDALPEEALERKERAQLIGKILDGLTDGQRLMIGMYYYDELSVEEIAQTLGLAQSSVRSQLSRGRRRIEEEVRRLEEKGVKLYGLAPLPFLVTLLRQQLQAPEPNKAVLQKVLAEEGGRQAALKVGRRFTETVLGRLVLGLGVAAVIGGGVAGWRWVKNHSAPPHKDELLEESVTAPTQPLDPTEPIDPTGPDSPPTQPTEPFLTEPKLTEEDTLPTLPVETEDSVPTEPDTTEPQPSEPQPTEPQPTEPQPTIPQPSDPQPTEPKPTEPQPTEPQPTDSQPTDPKPTDPQPTDPKPADSQPTESQPIAPAEASLSAFYWENTGTASISDVPWNMRLRVCAKVRGSAVPVLSTDDSTLLQITPQESLNYTDYETGEACFFWSVAATGGGTGHVYCSINGETKGTLVLSNPVYEEKIVGWKWDYSDTSSAYSCDTGETVRLQIWTQGKTVPSIQTDAANVIEIMGAEPFEGDGVTWLVKGQHWSIKAISPGTATISCVLNGQIVQTLTLTVIDPGKEQPSP